MSPFKCSIQFVSPYWWFRTELFYQQLLFTRNNNILPYLLAIIAFSTLLLLSYSACKVDIFLEGCANALWEICSSQDTQIHVEEFCTNLGRFVAKTSCSYLTGYSSDLSLDSQLYQVQVWWAEIKLPLPNNLLFYLTKMLAESSPPKADWKADRKGLHKMPVFGRYVQHLACCQSQLFERQAVKFGAHDEIGLLHINLHAVQAG